MDRIASICAELPPARVFADIGCDHGYMTRYMLQNGLCERAYISDISEGSLKKAKTLLAAEIAAGKCVPVVADGLEGLPETCDLVLIAGLGGETIVSILSKRELPPAFVLQPMKNADKVRAHLLARGASIDRDFTFAEERTGKFYHLIRGRRGGGRKEDYSAREIKWGRDNLNGASPRGFLAMMRKEREKLLCRLSVKELSARSRSSLSARLEETEEIIHDVERTV